MVSGDAAEQAGFLGGPGAGEAQGSSGWGMQSV